MTLWLRKVKKWRLDFFDEYNKSGTTDISDGFSSFNDDFVNFIDKFRSKVSHNKYTTGTQNKDEPDKTHIFENTD